MGVFESVLSGSKRTVFESICRGRKLRTPLRLFVVFIVGKHAVMRNTFDIVQHGIQGFLFGSSSANKVGCTIGRTQIGLSHKLSLAFSIEVLENSHLNLPGRRRYVTFRIYPFAGTKELVKGHGPLEEDDPASDGVIVE